MASQRSLYLSLFIATFAVSWAAILIKLAGAGPLPTAFYRMALASLILAIPAIPKLNDSFKNLSRAEIIQLVISGLMLAAHFAVWVTSLFYTTISNSAILVATQPIWVMFMERLIKKEKIPVRSITGMIIAVAGMIVITGGDINLSSEYIIGDLLALAGAVFAAIYLFIGRQLRARMDNLSYIFPVYAISAAGLLVICLFYRENLFDYSADTWFIFLLLALIPTVVGHSLYNWLLKYVSAHMVATTVLGEPIGATILAIFFFSQVPGWSTVVGGVMILAGIFIVLRRRKQRVVEITE